MLYNDQPQNLNWLQKHLFLIHITQIYMSAIVFLFSYLHFLKDSQIKTQTLGKDHIKVWLH